MTGNPYAPCPCGSGKKFKWCCQPIHEQLEKAYQLEEDGQHEAALQLIDQIIAQHADNPEPHGRKAQLLYMLGRYEQAEEALEQAFRLNPQYAYGHYLKARFRMAEGEHEGAVLLLRKAVNLFDPNAHETLAVLYGAIAECESRLNRPVAARAALQIAVRYDPTTEAYRKAMNEAFGPEARLPEAAKKEYGFQSQTAATTGGRKQAWTQALQTASTGKLTDAAKAFEELTNQDRNDTAAWYNLGLAKAWLGDNAGALQALDEYVQRETSEEAAAQAWALGEVLRCGIGLQDTEADYAEHSRTYSFRDGQKVAQMLQQMEQELRLVGAQMHPEQQIFNALVTEAPQVLVAQPMQKQTLRFAAHLMIVGNALRLWSTRADQLPLIGQEIEQKSQGALLNPVADRNPAYFSDILTEAIVFPFGAATEEEVKQATTDGAAKFYEDIWIHRPLRSLQGVAPVDAAGHGTLRKKLQGVVLFLEECGNMQSPPLYDFNRLRRKLGLLQPVAAAATAAPASAAGQDISAMSAAELAGLNTADLSHEQLDDAYQTAQRLDARDLARSFLEQLVARPGNTGRPDRLPWFQQLIQSALNERELDKALEYVDTGERHDCEHNEGRRRNDFELLRGRVHAKRGEVDAAQDVFERLIARVPSEMRYRGSAAEAMLSARQPERALHFAQEGLNQARKKQDRDSEQYFLELSDAAQKQKGG